MNKIKILKAHQLTLLLIYQLLVVGCNHNFRVVRVIDGDTIELTSGEKVRYIGIDTPEIQPPQGPEYLGEEAKEANRRLVEGKIVRLEFDVDKRDKYGRLLAYVFVDTIFVNAELLRLGYARVYFIPPNTRYRALFIKLEKEAKEESRGLWAKIVSFLNYNIKFRFRDWINLVHLKYNA